MSTLDTALWYASRGTGVVALVMFTLVVLLGILTRGGRTLPGLSGWVTSSFHRNASLVVGAWRSCFRPDARDHHHEFVA